MLKTWLAHPLTRGLDINNPQVTQLRRQIIQEKRFLNFLYQEWYAAIVSALPEGDGPVLELGSGAGFLSNFISHLITTEIFYCHYIRVVADAQQLPFADNSLRAIVMIDVLHHLPQPRHFLLEASRCVRKGGGIIMIEPWVTRWSQWVYTHLHHEPFRPEAKVWEFPSTGPLSGANGALPWIIFERDRNQFVHEFPQWQIETIKPMMPFRYLISGGVSLRSLTPSWSFELWRGIESMMQPWMNSWAMFAQITLTKQL